MTPEEENAARQVAILAKASSGKHVTRPVSPPIVPEEQAEKIEDLVEESVMLPPPQIGKWPDGKDKFKRPNKFILNVMEATKQLGVECYFDVFRRKEFVGCHEIQDLEGEISDAGVTMLRLAIRKQFRFYPDKEVTREAIIRRRGKRIICLIEDFQAHLDARSENAVQGKQGGVQC